MIIVIQTNVNHNLKHIHWYLGLRTFLYMETASSRERFLLKRLKAINFGDKRGMCVVLQPNLNTV